MRRFSLNTGQACPQYDALKQQFLHRRSDKYDEEGDKPRRPSIGSFTF